MKKSLALLLIGTSIMLYSCKQEKGHSIKIFEKIYAADYHDYYSNRLNYEFKMNGTPINANKICDLILADSANFVTLNRINLADPDFSEKSILSVHEKYFGPEDSYFFYKHIVNQSLKHGCLVLQIEYPVEESGRNKVMIFSLMHKRTQRINKSAYIRWTSLRADLYSHLGPEFAEKHPSYMWGINKSTDTVETNLSFRSIKALYPDFQGKYILKKYKEIIVDYNYSTVDQSLFNHITFIE